VFVYHPVRSFADVSLLTSTLAMNVAPLLPWYYGFLQMSRSVARQFCSWLLFRMFLLWV